MIGKQNEFANVLDEEGTNIENDLNEFAFKKFEDAKIYIFLSCCFSDFNLTLNATSCYFTGADPGFFVGWGAPPELPFDFNFNHFYRV